MHYKSKNTLKNELRNIIVMNRSVIKANLTAIKLCSLSYVDKSSEENILVNRILNILDKQIYSDYKKLLEITMLVK
jgi:hypothetical protein